MMSGVCSRRFCSTTVSASEAAEFFRKELAKLGWKEAKARGRGSDLFLQLASLPQVGIQKDAEGRTALKVIPFLFAAEKTDDRGQPWSRPTGLV
jgi:hypothetical protein